MNLVRGIANPSEILISSVGMMTFLIYGNIKHVPNHKHKIHREYISLVLSPRCHMNLMSYISVPSISRPLVFICMLYTLSGHRARQCGISQPKFDYSMIRTGMNQYSVLYVYYVNSVCYTMGIF